MGSGTGTGKGIREYEEMPFFLIPPVLMADRLDNYINVILSDVGEEGGKKIFRTYFTGVKEYRNTEKSENLKKIFTGFFDSLWWLEEKLVQSNLEKLACSIDMQTPDKNGFGVIQYSGKKEIGDFAIYRLIDRNLILEIIKGDWKKCLER